MTPALPLACVAAVALLALSACGPAGACGGYCGAGTHCEANHCVADVAQAEEPAAAADPEEGGRGKKRRKGRRRKGGSDGATEEAQLGPALRINDSHVPKFNPNRTETIPDGSERLSDGAVKKHMRSLETKFNHCIEQAALSTEDTLAGTVEFTIGIEPTGKVWGVTVTAPAVLKKSGVVACIRVAVHGSRFPTWDGPAMGVDYSFVVG